MRNKTGPQNENTHLQPLYVVLLLCCLSLAAVFIIQVYTQSDGYFVKKYYLGLDYSEFYRASTAYVEGRSPYSVDRYLTPPLPLLINLPLTAMTLHSARLVIFIVIPLFLFFSLLLICRIFFTGTSSFQTAIFSFAILLTGYPVYFLLDRLNIDGFVLFFICLGFYFLSRSDKKIALILAGLCLSIAFQLKLYPLVLFLPLMLMSSHRRKVGIWILLFSVLGILISPGLWSEFISQRLVDRSMGWEIDANCSIYHALYFLYGYTSSLFGSSQDLTPDTIIIVVQPLGTVLYIVILVLSLWSDFSVRHLYTSRSRDKFIISQLLLYLPFCIAIPMTVYQYELVILGALLPAICFLFPRAKTRLEKISLFLILSGYVVSQFHAGLLTSIVNNLYPQSIPSLGLLLVITGTSFYKMVHAYGLRHQGHHSTRADQEQVS